MPWSAGQFCFLLLLATSFLASFYPSSLAFLRHSLTLESNRNINSRTNILSQYILHTCDRYNTGVPNRPLLYHVNRADGDYFGKAPKQHLSLEWDEARCPRNPATQYIAPDTYHFEILFPFRTEPMNGVLVIWV